MNRICTPQRDGSIPVPTFTAATPDAAWSTIMVVVGAGVVAALQVGKAAIAAPLLQSDLALDLASLGWLTAIFAILGVVGGIPAGAMAAAVGDRRILVLGLVATALGAMSGAMAEGYRTLLVSRVVEGLGFLLITVAGPAVLQRVVSPGRKDIALSLWSCFMPVGMALAMLTTPLFASWRAFWWVSALLAATAIILTMVLVPRATATARSSRRRLAQDVLTIFRAGGPPLLAASFALYSLMFFALFSFLPVLLMDRMGVSLRTAGLLSAVATAVNILGNIAAGVLLSRGVQRSVLTGVAGLTMTVAGLGIFLPALPDTAVLLLCVLFSAVGGLLPATLLATIPVVAPASHLAPVVVGLVMQGSNLGQAIGPVAVGQTVDAFGWPSAAAVVSGAGLLGVMLSLLLGRVVRKARPSDG